MSIMLITVGKMKEKPYRMMADEYLKRLSRYGKVEVSSSRTCPSLRTPPLPSKRRSRRRRAKASSPASSPLTMSSP